MTVVPVDTRRRGTGEANTSIDNIAKIARAFGISVSALFAETEHGQTRMIQSHQLSA